MLLVPDPSTGTRTQFTHLRTRSLPLRSMSALSPMWYRARLIAPSGDTSAFGNKASVCLGIMEEEGR